MRISDWSSDVCSSDLDDHLEGARPQQQPHAGRGQDPDGDRQHQFHQPAPSGSIVPSAVTMVAPRGRRSDGCASASSISVVAPPTRQNTPRSNTNAEASGNRPSSGRSAYWKREVRNGWTNSTETRHGPTATHKH